jgi:hypothetical protein
MSNSWPAAVTDSMGVDSGPLPGRVRLLNPHSGDNDASCRSSTRRPDHHPH